MSYGICVMHGEAQFPFFYRFGCRRRCGRCGRILIDKPRKDALDLLLEVMEDEE